MHHDELWQLYRRNGEAIPGAGWKSSRDNPYGEDDEIVGVAIVFLFRRLQSGEVEFLWQERSQKVDRFPGFYDLSAGGHINLGETVIEAAQREAREEIGIEVKPEELLYGFMQPFNKNRFAWLYFVDWTDKPEEFSFNDSEVASVKWVNYKDMRDFIRDFAKPPLAADKTAFLMVDEWLKMYGYV